MIIIEITVCLIILVCQIFAIKNHEKLRKENIRLRSKNESRIN